MRELFPDLDLTKIQKTTTRKNASYQEWMMRHCRQTQYAFQIRKCEERSCCLETKLPAEQLFWLPDPVVDDSNEGHYKPYSAVKGIETTEADRPSLKDTRKKQAKKNSQACATQQGINTTETETHVAHVEAGDPLEDQIEKNADANHVEVAYAEVPVFDPAICSAQNARSVILCVECEKPRVVYSRHRLTHRQQMPLTLTISNEYEYTCGSVLLPPSNPHYKTIMCRTEITCETPIQLPFYRSGLGKPELCCYCASEDGVVDQVLNKKFQTVLPICAFCKESGKHPIVQRPYGKKSKW